MNTSPVVVERILKAPAARVWQAITDKEQMKQWYFDIPAFIPEPGFEFQFYGTGREGEQYLHHCRITEVIPEKKLSYSWRYEGYEGISQVTFELFAEGETTRLVLTHTGLHNFPATERNIFARENFEAGWSHLVGTALPAFVTQ